jgi:hypothetical protein
MMDEGLVGRGDRTEVKLPAVKVVWLEAPESVTQLVTAGGTIAMVWREGVSGCWSQELIHCVHTIGGGGARGSVDVSYAAPQAHRIANVALHREYSQGIIFIFSEGGRISIMSKTNVGSNSHEYY